MSMKENNLTLPEEPSSACIGSIYCKQLDGKINELCRRTWNTDLVSMKWMNNLFISNAVVLAIIWQREKAAVWETTYLNIAQAIRYNERQNESNQVLTISANRQSCTSIREREKNHNNFVARHSTFGPNNEWKSSRNGTRNACGVK